MSKCPSQQYPECWFGCPEKATCLDISSPAGGKVGIQKLDKDELKLKKELAYRIARDLYSPLPTMNQWLDMTNINDRLGYYALAKEIVVFFREKGWSPQPK